MRFKILKKNMSLTHLMWTVFLGECKMEVWEIKAWIYIMLSVRRKWWDESTRGNTGSRQQAVSGAEHIIRSNSVNKLSILGIHKA